MGGVDVAVDVPDEAPILIELKWGAGNLYNCAWDARQARPRLKRGRGFEGVRRYAGAPLGGLAAPWRLPPGRSLLPIGTPRRSWIGMQTDFAGWRAAVTTRPTRLPDEFSTERVHLTRLLVDGAEWEIRCAEVFFGSAELLEVDEGGVVTQSPTGVMPVRETLDDPSLDDPAAPEQRIARKDRTSDLIGEHQLLTEESESGDPRRGAQLRPSTRQLLRFRTGADRTAFLQKHGWLVNPENRVWPAALSVSLDGPLGSWLVIWEDDAVTYRTARLPEARGKPTDEEWAHFWGLIEQLGAWRWRRWYTPEQFATDHLGWRVVLAQGGRLVSSRGYAAFPPVGDDAPGPVEKVLREAAKLALGADPGRILKDPAPRAVEQGEMTEADAEERMMRDNNPVGGVVPWTPPSEPGSSG